MQKFIVKLSCCCPVTKLCPTLRDPVDGGTPGFPVLEFLPSLSFPSMSLLKLMSVELVMPSNHVILCHLLFLTSIFPSIRVFSKELALRIRWPKYWSLLENQLHHLNLSLSLLLIYKTKTDSQTLKTNLWSPKGKHGR